MFQTFLTRRTLKGHLSTPRELQEHCKGTWALEHLRHLGTRRALEHLGTQGTWALAHLKETWALEALYLADSIWYLCIN